jgi:hypothetical protein
LPTRRVNDRLHLARHGINAAAQVKLHSDGGQAQRAGGGHFVQPGDAPELAFEGCSHRRGHDVRAGTGQAGFDLNGGELHLRERRDGQKLVPYTPYEN